MTTIAYRDGIVAADTGATMGGSTTGHVVKIVRNDFGDVAGATGDAGWLDAFQRWFTGGEIGDPPEIKHESHNCDYSKGIIFRRDGSFRVFESSGSFTLRADYFAIGSGRCEAIGAMWKGALAEEAVRAAIAHDDGTFGDVTVLHVG